jgi:DnaJ family protein C protein 7
MKFFSKSSKKSKNPTATEEQSDLARSPPRKSSSPTKSKARRAKDETQSPRPTTPLSRTSRTFTKSRSTSDSPRYSYDPNSHPLNLPPDEIRRLSALSTMADSMDVDTEQQMPGSFDAPQTNGTSNGEEAPAPPPHKSSPSSLDDAAAAPAPAPTAEDAEAFKTEGNKFYKNKEYKKAIEAYTKGNF